MYREAQEEIDTIDNSRPTAQLERELIWQRTCAAYLGRQDEAEELTRQLKRMQSYDQYDWLFLTGNTLFDESVSPAMRFAILDILKEKQDITAEDLVRLGMFTEETRYHSYLFGLIRENVANQAAGLLELSYRLSRMGTTIAQASVMEQIMRAEQQSSMLYYLRMQAGLTYTQIQGAAGSAIRMGGATSAAPGYESVSSDYYAYNFTEYDITHGYGKFAVNDSGYFETPGSSSRVRIMNGTVDEAYALFDHLSSGYTHESVAGYGGVTRELPNGGYVTFRPDSKSGSPAIDIRGIPGIKKQKIHFELR